MSTPKHQRTETDALGSVCLPKDAYWGVHTERARCNFAISGITLGQYPCLVSALVQIKHAAAITNGKLGVIEPNISQVIQEACIDIVRQDYTEQFVVDMIQGGAGTSSNMNANEVIANRAIELCGGVKGDYHVIHPNDHVNASQSTNDVYPSAIKLAVLKELDRLLIQMEAFKTVCIEKRDEFSTILKLGRTQLQDAVPMTLGQEFGAYSTTIEEDIARLRESTVHLCELNIGATAIGTGINAPVRFSEHCVEELRRLSGFNLRIAENLIEATSDAGGFVLFSGVVKRAAIKLSKVCNDLRLLSSGPRGGLGEIRLPAVQAGSSIMPGKVNPVIPEVVNQIAYMIMGNDVTISCAAESGQLQLNAFEPVIAFRLLNSVRLLTEGFATLTDKCIRGVEADAEKCRQNLNMSIGLATYLNPEIGYAASSDLAKQALLEGRTISDVAEAYQEGLSRAIDQGLSIAQGQ
ncbi:aspartate ammonia-lyase [Roseibium denhamense]|uniref:Aspartate ammonia-lyase n=1 Tax=Roseibium denhamense TaxID=76305 RepID=A0ABY1NCS0_9HYPH|nr:aspartate ammonia-lyase [Roseibium denhamense]MTI06670.1 aspartate ammonia-lyase [Roseibium denhamense]SMP06554.1 aspartate ammonia-lyase [Roseibium denhamense]